jgi:hypothetical protein
MDKIKLNIINEISESLWCIGHDNDDLQHKFKKLLPEDLTDTYIENNAINSYLHAMESEVKKIEKLLKLLK